jgi:predicted HTH domain antitoxin
MIIALPDDSLAAQQLSEAEIKIELALSLYAINRVTLIQAADMAGLDFFEFQEMLRIREVPQHYSEQDLESDQETLAALS